VLLVLCRYERKRHYDSSDGHGYVSTGDVRLAKESRFSQNLMTSEMTGSLADMTGVTLPPQQFQLLMAPPAPWQTVPASEHIQSALQHSDETVSTTVSLPSSSSMHH